MKHKLLNILVLFFLGISTNVYTQTVSFDCEVSDGSYGSISDYGDWRSNNAMTYGNGKQYAGSKALVFDDDAGAYLLYEGSDGNGKDGGLGGITFYYRHWDGDGHTVKFKVQYNKAGAGWVDVGSEVTVSSTSYTQYNESVNISGDDILVRILSTAYQERCLIDDVVITGYGGSSGSSSFHMSDDGSINESHENGEIITITLVNDTFVSSLNSNNWSIFNQPSGVSLSSVSRINDTTAELTLSGNRNRDYDSDITDFAVSIDHSELQNLSSGSLTASSGVSFTALDDAESLSMADDGNISEGSEDGESITITLSGGTFANPINSSHWTLGNAPGGVSIGSMSRTSDTSLTLTLSGNATSDYDNDISNAQITCTADELDDYTGANITMDSGIIFKALIESQPTVQATNLSFPSSGATAIDLSWTRGNGEKVLVVAREGQAISSYPVDGQDYTAGNAFGSGADLGGLQFVVYKGTGTSVSVSNLNQGKEYFFRVFEYNNDSSNTRYDTAAATGNPASSYTKPNDVTNFTMECISKNTAFLSWTVPTGSYDSIIVAARQSTYAVHSLSGNGSTYLADSTFGLGSAFGSTSPSSYVVYKGRGNHVMVQGLNPGSSYTFKAVVYKGSLWSSGKNKTAQVAEIKEISNLQHYAPDREIVLNWNNPDFNCPDEVMIVMRKDSAVSNTPSGYGSQYTASATFGTGTDIGTQEYVVYKGTGDGINITGLTNGETYYYTFFVRDDSSWSDGVQAYDTPNDISILFQGDLAILAVNTNNSTGVDEISLVCFDTIKTGTSIDFTDNGWERSYPDYWGSTEGVIRFTRTGPDILPGEVFTFSGAGHQASDFSASGLSDNSWSISSLNGNNDFNLNNSDQVWIMQYGTWSNGSNAHHSSYSGNVLYGWTATGWAGDPGHGSHGSTSYSALYPSGECFNTNVVNTSNKSKVKYTGPTTSASRREWIARINDDNNWTGYSSNAAFDAATPVYTSGINLPVAASSYSDGEWIGDADSNWFNCGNWSDLEVPDENKDVLISNHAQRQCVISADANYSDDFGDTAKCKNLSINDSTLLLSGSNDILSVDGDINLNGGLLQLDTGQLMLTGQWNNNTATAFQAGKGTLVFAGNAPQYINNSTGTESFHKLILNNSYKLYLNTAVNLSHLHFQAGKLILNQHSLTLSDSITGYNANQYLVTDDNKASTAYLNFPVTTSEVLIPIGNSGSYNPVKISLSSGSASFQFRVFSHLYENGLSGNSLTGDLVDKTWVILSPAGSFTADITLQWNVNEEIGQFGTSHAAATMIFNDNTGTGSAFADWSTLNNSGAVNGTNPFTIKATSLSNFGSFGVGTNCTINKPVTSKIYHY